MCDVVETGVGNGEVTLMESVWSGIARERVMGFINALHTFRRDGQRDGEELGRKELEKELQWCLGKFREGRWEDASKAYARYGEKVKKIGNEMVSGERLKVVLNCFVIILKRLG